MRIFLLIIFSITLNHSFTQCTVQGSVTQNVVPCNECVTLTANGFGENVAAFVENFNSGQPVGWQFTQTVTISSTTCGIPSLDGSPFMWMGSSSPAPRTMATLGLDVSAGGTVCFEMRYAIQQQNSPCEGPDLGDEGVTLQYSINNGASWVTINYWPPLNGGFASSMTVWNEYCENIPIAAQTTSTMFRWTQLEATSSSYDHWGLDNVEITLASPDYNMTWLHDNYSYGQGNYTGDNPTQVCPEGDTIFVVEMTDGINTCYDTVEIAVDFPVINNINATNPFCGGINGEIEISSSGGTTDYQYSIDNGTYFQSSSVFTELDSLTYQVILLDANNCSDTSMITLTGVDSLFIIDLLFENSSCGTDNGSISFNGVGGTPVYQYSIDNGTSYSTTALYTDLAPGTYELILLDDVGCSDSTNLEILPSTNPVIDSLIASEDFCSLSNGTLNAFASLGVSPYIYSIVQINDTITSNPNGSFENLSSGSYQLFLSDSLNCFTTADFIIDETPAPSIELMDTALCNLFYQVTDVESFTGSIWSASSPNISFDDNTTSNPSFTASESGQYLITYEDTLCSTEESFQITFIPNPNTEIRDTILCIGEFYELEATIAPQNISYLWNTGSTSTSVNMSETGLFIVTVSNSCGEFSDSANIVFFDCDLEPPNVFTPNDDGINDNFKLIQFQGIKSFQCYIYNRWGNLMADYDKPDFQWDGNNKKGDKAEDGVYFYVIQAVTNGGKEINKHGKIHLISND
ncbi:gliding motility-associated C-terminal domain-containing protein [Crocinitomicaceae bacterium]|nr:gliding motility-associated C-terminal domain-containing protein [Crocinitomicaceae bacterium]